MENKYNDDILEVHQAFLNASDLFFEKFEEKQSKLRAEFNPDRVERLKRLGFVANREVVNHGQKLTELKKEMSAADIVQGYRQKFPQKFITTGQVKELCKKYGLIVGPISRYIEVVPEKNLLELEKFQNEHGYPQLMRRNWNNEWLISRKGLDKFSEDEIYDMRNGKTVSKWSNYNKITYKLDSLYSLAAPIEHFDTKGMVLNDYKLEVPKPVSDPIVLFEVKHGYIIVTAWGDEAQDPAVFNEKRAASAANCCHNKVIIIIVWVINAPI